MTTQEQQTPTPEELVGGETPQEDFTITNRDGPPIEAKKPGRTVEDRLAELQAERLADDAAEKAKSPCQKAKEKADAKAEEIDGIPSDKLEQARDDLLDAVRDADADLADKLMAKDNPTGISLIGISLTAPMLMAINDSDNPVALLRHLAENPETAQEIVEMSPKRMEHCLLKIEIQIEAQASDPITLGTWLTRTRLARSGDGRLTAHLDAPYAYLSN